MKFPIKILIILILVILFFSLLGAETWATDPAAGRVREVREKIYSILWYVGIALAGLILVFGGFIWLTSFGSPERIAKAVAWIKAAIVGLCILVSADALLGLLGVPTVTGRLIGITIDISPIEIEEERALPKWRCMEVNIQGILNDFIVLKRQALEYAYWLDEVAYGTIAHNQDFKRKLPDRRKLIYLGLKADLEIKGIVPKTKEIVELAQECKCDRVDSEVLIEHSLKSPSHCPSYPLDEPPPCPELTDKARILENQIIRNKDVIALLKQEEWGIKELITKEIENENEIVIIEKIENEIKRILRRKALPQELAKEIISFLEQELEQDFPFDPTNQADQKQLKELKKQISLILEAALSTRIALLEQVIKKLNEKNKELNESLKIIEDWQAVSKIDKNKRLFSCPEAMAEKVKANCQDLNFFLCETIIR